MHKKGFTLIELLVVIAIIGILAAIGITAFGGAQSKARDTKRKGDIGSLAASLTLYFDATEGKYPAGTTAALVSTAGTPLQAAAASATNGFAIPKSPSATPGGATDYWYISGQASSANDMMALFTQLENRPTGATVAAWFVNNSRGFADTVGTSVANHDVAPTNANTDCALTAGAAPIIYHPCSSTVAF